MTKLRAVVNSIATKEGFTMVFDAAGLAYAPDALDLTNQLIRTYNEQNKAKPVAAPTKKSDAPKK